MRMTILSTAANADMSADFVDATSLHEAAHRPVSAGPLNAGIPQHPHTMAL
jgi:hypothetical protein